MLPWQPILFLLHSKLLRVRTIRSNVLTLQSNMLQCVSAWGLSQVVCLRNLQGEAERRESTAEDNLLYLRRGHQSPNLAQGFHPERMEGDRHGMMLAYTGVCLQRTGTTNLQCLKRPGATKLEFKGEHQPCSFPHRWEEYSTPWGSCF